MKWPPIKNAHFWEILIWDPFHVDYNSVRKSCHLVIYFYTTYRHTHPTLTQQYVMYEHTDRAKSTSQFCKVCMLIRLFYHFHCQNNGSVKAMEKSLLSDSFHAWFAGNTKICIKMLKIQQILQKLGRSLLYTMLNPKMRDLLVLQRAMKISEDIFCAKIYKITVVNENVFRPIGALMQLKG